MPGSFRDILTTKSTICNSIASAYGKHNIPGLISEELHIDVIGLSGIKGIFQIKIPILTAVIVICQSITACIIYFYIGIQTVRQTHDLIGCRYIRAEFIAFFLSFQGNGCRVESQSGRTGTYID